MTTLSRMIAATVVAVAVAAPALAHTAEGTGGLMSVDHLISLLAIGLLLSQRDLRAGLGLLMAGIAAGVALPFAGVTFFAAAMPMLAIAIVAGGSLAMARHLPAAFSLLVSLFVGLSVGLQTDVPMDTPLIATPPGAGVIVAAFLIAAYAMAIGTALRTRWQGIPLGVVGSWIAAIAIMMLAFLVRDMAVLA